jgi:hypothetical protein
MKNKKEIIEIINLLKEIDIDGETMEDILDQVGLREQVVHQIIESEKYIATKKLWDDIQNNETLLSKSFDAYYTQTFLS